MNNISNNKSYGVHYEHKEQSDNVSDYCFINDNIVKIPLGEIMFNIIEALDVIKALVQNDISITEFDNCFAAKKYSVKNIILACKADIAEAKRLQRIKHFIHLCSQDSERCSNEYLDKFVSSLYCGKESILFNGKIFKRKIFAPQKKASFMGNEKLNDINKYISKKYISYSFYSNTHFDTLSELCILSLYEIFDLGLKISECYNCKHFYIIKNNGYLCDRELLENDYRGCNKYHEYLNNLQYRSNKLVKQYKKVYGRLYSRTKCKSFSSAAIFNSFKNEWAEINSCHIDKAEKQKKQLEFLKDERWK